MNTLHFKYAVEIERTGSITQAADSLFMSQPNLSKAIKELEETLGITIFRRTSKGVIPTEQGAKFLEYARNILTQVQAMEALSAPEGRQEPFSVSMPMTDYLADGFFRFAAGLPARTALRCLEGSALETVAHLTEDSIRLGILRFPVEAEQYFADYLHNRGLEFSFLWEFAAVVLVSGSHPLAGQELIREEELAGFPQISPGRQAVPYLSQEEVHRQPDRPEVICPAGQTRLKLLTTQPDTYLWSAPVTGAFCREWGLVQLRSPDAGQFKDLLIHRRNHQFSPEELAFIDRLFEARNAVAFGGKGGPTS